jgi:hypothetical protein
VDVVDAKQKRFAQTKIILKSNENLLEIFKWYNSAEIADILVEFFLLKTQADL